jgi:hypothetical protein
LRKRRRKIVEKIEKFKNIWKIKEKDKNNLKILKIKFQV